MGGDTGVTALVSHVDDPRVSTADSSPARLCALAPGPATVQGDSKDAAKRLSKNWKTMKLPNNQTSCFLLPKLLDTAANV